MRLAKAACALFLLGVTTTSCSAASEVKAVYMALDSNGDRVRDTFYTDTTTIVCNIDWVGNSADTTIDAKIVQTSPIGAVMAAGEQPGTEGEASFSFTWTMQSASGGGTAPFPTGTFECDVTVNGEPAGISKFQILWPPKDSKGNECPAEGAATPGAQCQGWVEQGSVCPSAANLAQQCSCNGATWSGC